MKLEAVINNDAEISVRDLPWEWGALQVIDGPLCWVELPLESHGSALL